MCLNCLKCVHRPVCDTHYMCLEKYCSRTAIEEVDTIGRTLRLNICVLSSVLLSYVLLLNRVAITHLKNTQIK